MNQNLAVPLAIVVAGVLIAGALFFAGRGAAPAPQDGGTPATGDEITIEPVSADEHILGNPDADIVIVEYSDLECPFCKQFHVTMQQIIDEYGPDGTVAWVYRHFPLSQLHPKAPKESEASECAWEQGGNDAFWAYVNRVYEITPSNNGLDLAQLPIIAGDIGLDVNAFNTCLDSGKYASKVEAQFNDAIAAGGQGTPHNVILLKSGERVAFPGAQPYATVKNVIETIIAEQGL
ncbi:MAG: DsbA family protein [Candidatus Paceibacteria bacterium]